MKFFLKFGCCTGPYYLFDNISINNPRIYAHEPVESTLSVFVAVFSVHIVELQFYSHHAKDMADTFSLSKILIHAEKCYHSFYSILINHLNVIF